MTITTGQTEKEATGRVILDMMTENTGRHFLDSGGAYGRHWEQNEGLTLEALRDSPEATLEAHVWHSTRSGRVEYDLSFSLSLWHFLEDRLVYDEGEDTKWLEWATSYDPDNSLPWLPIAEAYAQSRIDSENEYLGGRYYRGGDTPLVVNTYNGEDALTQIIQYVQWEEENTTRVLLQIHGGCDARGGYTRARYFHARSDYDEYPLVDNDRGTVACKGSPSHYWDTEDAGYEWHYQAQYELPISKALSRKSLNAYPYRPYNPHDFRRGYLMIDEEERVYCPLCGNELEVYPFPSG